MIIRTTGDTLVLIRQNDHAAMAADLMARWTAAGLPESPRREAILAATRAHDNGWVEEDDQTIVEGGLPVDFIRAPAAVKQRVWFRAIEPLSQREPRVAALIAQHALTVYPTFRTDAEWSDFFERMIDLRTELLARCDEAAAAAILEDYQFVRLGDLLSLLFCTETSAPVDYAGYRLSYGGRTLTVSPDPFGGASVPFSVPGRRVQRRPYESAADFRAAVAAAPVEILDGTAIGADS